MQKCSKLLRASIQGEEIGWPLSLTLTIRQGGGESRTRPKSLLGAFYVIGKRGVWLREDSGQILGTKIIFFFILKLAFFM